MKKIILTVIAVLALTCANAQIITDAGTFTKPDGKTTIFEATLTPDLTGGGIFSLPDVSSGLGLVGVRIRDFSSATKAMRYGAHLSMHDSGIPGDDTEFAIGASVGVERHRAGAERLSTCWGYEGNAGYVTKNDHYGGSTKKFGVGASIFTGADYYFIPKVYLGAEIAYSVAVTNIKHEHGDDITRIESGPGITPSFRVGWQF